MKTIYMFLHCCFAIFLIFCGFTLFGIAVVTGLKLIKEFGNLIGVNL